MSFQADFNPSLPPAIFGVMSLVAAVLAGCLPETKGIELYNDIDDVKAGPFQKIVCRHRSSSGKRKVDKVVQQAKEMEALALEG